MGVGKKLEARRQGKGDRGKKFANEGGQTSEGPTSHTCANNLK